MMQHVCLDVDVALGHIEIRSSLNQDTRINLGQCPSQATWGKVKGVLRF